MKSFFKVLVLIFFFPLFSTAQDEEAVRPDYAMLELNYMKTKPGMEMKFVEAVKRHNAKYHPKDSPYNATLFYIRTGNDAGWYVWAMGALTYSDLDDAPGAGDHRDDWAEYIAPYVAEYGPIEMWRYDEVLSSSDDDSEMMQVLWFIGIKRGDYLRFKAFMEKVQVIFDEKNEDMHVWINQYKQEDGRDVAISWPFDKWSDLDEDDWNMKEAYEEKYGEGSWDNTLEEWEDFVETNIQEVWLTVPQD